MKLGDRKARLLKELEITEVSLVTSAANEGAKIMFWKNDSIDFNKLNSLSVEKLNAAKRDAALIKRLKKMGDDMEAMKAMSQNTIDIYDKLKIERMKMGTVVEKILSKAFESQGEAVNSLKLDLTKRAPAEDRRIPEKRLIDFLDNHPEVEAAIQELPNVAKVEVQETRDFGKAYAQIQKKIDELISNGEVASRAKLFMKVVDSDPALLVEYYKDRI